jgi:hypothetical protein
MVIDEGARKKIIIIALALTVAIGVTIFRKAGGDKGTAGLLAKKVLKCKQCSHVLDTSKEDLLSIMAERNTTYIEEVAQENPDQADLLKKLLGGPMGTRVMNPAYADIIPQWGNLGWPLTCPSCNEDSLYFANKCPKCGETSFTTDDEGNYTDKCPKCGYSGSEELSRRNKAKKAAERAERSEKRKKRQER